MLLFIQRETEVICSEVPVSIHLMLLFIEVSGVGSAVVEAFQYISCYSLSTSDAGIAVFFCVSIHLMLLFIYPLSFRLFKSKMFQYISCYSLSRNDNAPVTLIGVSIHLMLLFIVSPIKLTFVFALFQYISCYSLSCTLSICLSTFAVSIHLMLLFINVRVRNPVHYDGFNTSHVTLYHFCIQTIKRLLHRFNTSHVTLYRFNTIFFCLGFDVSIHLMLLFISCFRCW